MTSTSPAGHTRARTVGRVVEVRAYPVKSLDAGPLLSSPVHTSGLEHDRGWAVVDSDGEVVTAREAPVLRGVRASLPQAAGQLPAVLLPGSEFEVRDASAAVALSQVVGRSVTLRAAKAGSGFTEVAAVHLVSRQAVQAAVGAEVDIDDPACSIEQPRANIVLDLTAAELETGWVGREVQVGEVVLRISQQPQHCLGVYAEVTKPGIVEVGADVRVADLPA